jgi:hypothetical protein
MLATELGKLRLALRSPSDHDEAELPDEGHQVGMLFGNSEMADREKDSVLSSLMNSQPAPQPTPVEPLVADRPSHTVRVISGSNVQEVVMQGGAEDSNSGTLSGMPPKSGAAASFLWKIISTPSPKTDAQGGSTPNLAPTSNVEPPMLPKTAPDMEPAEPADTRTPETDG